ncbi:MAG: hypothetical protein ACOYB2_10945 [Limnohabitans sp.]
MNDHTFRKIAVAAMSAAADVMDSTDPDDRSVTQVALVDLCKELLDAANHGDTDARDILFEAVPSWFGLCEHMIPADLCRVVGCKKGGLVHVGNAQG